MVKCCNCLCFRNNDNDRSTNYSENGVVSERQYGCYRLGILVALVIVLLLIVLTVPTFFVINNNNIILIVIIIAVLLVGALIFLYYEWQHRQAINQRERCRDEWNVQSRTYEHPLSRNNRPQYADSLYGSSWTFLTIKKNQNMQNRVPLSTMPPTYSQV